MATATTARLDSWKEKWDDFYSNEFATIVSHEGLTSEKKTEGVEFLNSISKNMDNVLADLFKIRTVFDEMYFSQIVLHGAKNLFDNGFEFKKCFGPEYGIVKFYNEHHQLIFDPFVLEDEMKAEFIATTNTDFFFTINIYENEPERIDFFIEYQTAEDEERLKETNSLLDNTPSKIITEDDEDEENVAIEGVHLQALVQWKFDNLKNNLQETLGDEFQKYITDMRLEKHTTEDGELNYLIQISDLSVSFTTITCHKFGYRFHWGSSTPGFLRAMIEEAMEGNNF